MEKLGTIKEDLFENSEDEGFAVSSVIEKGNDRVNVQVIYFNIASLFYSTD